MISKQLKHFLILALCLIATHYVVAQQAVLETFGQNRIQTRKFAWQYYDSSHFRVLYYDYGKFNAQYILQQSEIDIPKIEALMGVQYHKKINIVLYNSFTDFKQTNIGRYNEDLAIGDNFSVDFAGNTVVVFFNGNHDDLRVQIKKGVVKIIEDNLLFGTTIKEVVRNKVKLKLPLWFTQGYVQYLSTPWDADKQAKITSLISSKKETLTFRDFSEMNPELIGQSFFNYLQKTYGDGVINNLFFLTSKRKKINISLATLCNKNIIEIYSDWRNYYYNDSNITVKTNIGARQLAFKVTPKANAVLKAFAVNSQSTQVAYCEVLDGQYEVKLLNKDEKHGVTILEGGLRNSIDITDPSYPVICWNNDGTKMAIMYEKDYAQRLKIYDAKRGRVIDRIILGNKFDRLNSLGFMDDDDKLVISAIKKGQCDLYQYVIKNAQLVNITKDIWDEISPNYITNKNMKGILFLSNRTKPNVVVPLANGELPNSNFNIYFYDDKTGSTRLIPFTNEQDIKITNPIQYGPDDIAFLADINGAKQRIVAHTKQDRSGRDSIYYSISNQTDYSIMAQTFTRTKNALSEVIEKEGAFYVYYTKYDSLKLYDEEHPAATYAKLSNITNAKLIDKKDQPSTYFLSEFDNDIDSVKVDIDVPKRRDAFAELPSEIAKPKRFKSRTYIPTFNTDFLQVSADNSAIFERYQNIKLGNGLASPSIGALLKLSLFDIMENYKLTGGIKIPTSLDGSLAYLLKFANYTHRTDWEIAFFHNSNLFLRKRSFSDSTFFSPYQEKGKQIANYIQGTLTYPFSVTTSLKFITGLRQDKLLYLARTDTALVHPVANDYWNFNRVEYIYDNTFKPLKNISKGTKFKIYTEAFVKVNNGNGTMFNTGLDVRHYLPIYKNVIIAARVAAATSYGSTPMLYMIGGIDNQINPPISAENTIGTYTSGLDYGYRTNVTTLRGYGLNQRQGSSYAGANLELRFPVANTFTSRTIKSNFIRNFMLVGFFDVASAWNGGFINGAESEKRVSNITGQAYGIAQSGSPSAYGIGIRSMLFGYFINLNYAKGVDNDKYAFNTGLAMDF
jgi:hypothetical protein